MSKYTTQVRFICETASGLNESVGFDNIDNVIAKSWNKIFTNKFPIFDESYRSVICQKILKHYYTREICAETVGLWKLWLNTAMEEIMPYYNQMYKSQLLQFNPLYDVDYTVSGDRNKEEKRKETSDNIGEYVDRQLYSDTPQGSLTGIENEEYLTNATKNTGEDNRTITNNGSINNTEDYLEKVNGKRGGQSYSKMLEEYRATFLNIDMMLINDLNDLFFGLW